MLVLVEMESVSDPMLWPNRTVGGGGLGCKTIGHGSSCGIGVGNWKKDGVGHSFGGGGFG